jgi:hypothetical protein
VVPEAGGVVRRALALGRVNHRMEMPSCALSLSHRGRVSVSDVDAEKMGSVAQWRNVPADIGYGEGECSWLPYGSSLEEKSNVRVQVVDAKKGESRGVHR